MTKNLVPTKNTWLVFGAVVIYFIGIRRWLEPGGMAQVEIVVLGGLLVTMAFTSLAVIISLIALAFQSKRVAWLRRLRQQLIFLLTIAGLVAVIGLASQWMAYTPPILGADGQTVPNSIASLEKVRLGGVDQWLIIRGQDVNKPVLLFLSGGPGASESARVLRFNQELEKHFVVVIWEQRGCGKSYPSLNPKSALTVEQYTVDLIELTDMLRERFNEKKVYLVGHSWGTIIGVRAVQARPDLFHAYVGTAQMIDVLETDQIIYHLVADQAREVGDTQFLKTLEGQGEPPYNGKSPIQPYATLFGREYQEFEFPLIVDEEYRRDGDILMLMLKQPEYGWLDRVYYLLGLVNTFNVVYPQLQEMDFRLDAARLDLPVYLMLGRNDMNAPYWLPEEYFNLLEAPSKQLFFFENSGHGLIWEEADIYHDLLANIVLPETYQP